MKKFYKALAVVTVTGGAAALYLKNKLTELEEKGSDELTEAEAEVKEAFGKAKKKIGALRELNKVVSKLDDSAFTDEAVAEMTKIAKDAYDKQIEREIEAEAEEIEKDIFGDDTDFLDEEDLSEEETNTENIEKEAEKAVIKEESKKED